MSNRLDIVVFGATGFAGQYTLPYVYKLSKEKGLTWGIAGRSKKKLVHVLKKTAQRVDVEDLDSVPIFVANLLDENSMAQMTSKAKVIINVCGPYVKYGEAVVKSCIETGTHHVDVSGEAYFHESIDVKYHKAAEGKGVYMIMACGFDSVASELGIRTLRNSFSGTLNSVEIYVSLKKSVNDNWPIFSIGSWETAIHGLPTIKQFRDLHKSRNLSLLPSLKPKLLMRWPFSKAHVIGKPHKRVLPFISPDEHVVQRTERFLYETYDERPIQVKFYSLINSWIYMVMIIMYFIVIFILTHFEFGKLALSKYPEFFSNGCFSHEKPAEEEIENTVFNVYFYGEGWDDDVIEVEEKCNIPPNKAILAELKVKNPGYGFTCLAATLAAVTLLTETAKLPSKGGLFSPSAAFHNTTYMSEIERLSDSVSVLDIKRI